MRSVAAVALATLVLGATGYLLFARRGSAPGPTTAAALPSAVPSMPAATGGRLVGRLLDDLAAPVIGARVLTVAATSWEEPAEDPANGAADAPDSAPPPAPPPLVEARSGADGRFAVDPPRDVPLVLAVHHPDFAVRVLHTDLWLPPDRRFDLGDVVLPTGPGLLVEVRTPEGIPVAGAQVRLTPALRRIGLPDAIADLFAATAHTASDGVATFFGVARGPWELRASATGHATLHLPHEQPEHPATSPRAALVLPRARALTGRVRTAAGQPAAGARVFARALDPDGNAEPPLASTSTDERGAFRLDGVAPGTLRLAVLHPEGSLLREDVAAGGPVLELQLAQGRILTGQVLHAATRRPVAGARVSARLPARWSLAFPGVTAVQDVCTDETGKFRFRGLPDGILRLEAASQGLCSAASPPQRPALPEAPPDAVTLLLPDGCTVTGQILSPSGLPRPSAVIRPIPVRTPGPLPGAPALPRAVRSTAGGGFRIRGLAPGRYRLRVESPGQPVLLGPEFTARSGDVDLGPLRLSHGCTVHGTAFLRSGAPAAGATVYIHPLPSAPETDAPIPTARTDARGGFELPSVAPGTYRMFYDYKDRQTPGAAAATREASRVDLELRNRGTHQQDLRVR